MKTNDASLFEAVFCLLQNVSWGVLYIVFTVRRRRRWPHTHTCLQNFHKNIGLLLDSQRRK